MFLSKLKRAIVMTTLAASAIAPAAALAGDIAGAGCVTERVGANRTDVYRIQFVPGQPAWVSIRGDGDTDLDLQVIDPDGRTVCAEVGTSDREQCTWQPTSAGVTQVRILNHGDVFNEYRFCTN